LAAFARFAVICSFDRNAADDAVTADRQTPPMDIEAISNAVIGAAIRVHSALGPGLLESTYRVCLAHELHLLGLDVREEASLPVAYRGIRIDAGYRIDLLVDDKLIVELKVVERIRRVHEAQLLAYLKLSGRAVGLLINFHVPQLRLGIKRLVNNYKESSTTTRPNDAT
jgi:GxxExxY protein